MSRPSLPVPESRKSREISLYRQLLHCLEEEWEALRQSREEAILTLAARKEEILTQLVKVGPSQPGESPDEVLAALQRQTLAAQNRNRRIIIAAMEVIQDFLSRLQPETPGTYLAAGKVGSTSGASYFRRRA